MDVKIVQIALNVNLGSFSEVPFIKKTRGVVICIAYNSSIEHVK